MLSLLYCILPFCCLKLPYCIAYSLATRKRFGVLTAVLDYFGTVSCVLWRLATWLSPPRLQYYVVLRTPYGAPYCTAYPTPRYERRPTQRTQSDDITHHHGCWYHHQSLRCYCVPCMSQRNLAREEPASWEAHHHALVAVVIVIKGHLLLFQHSDSTCNSSVVAPELLIKRHAAPARTSLKLERKRRQIIIYFKQDNK